MGLYIIVQLFWPKSLINFKCLPEFALCTLTTSSIYFSLELNLKLLNALGSCLFIRFILQCQFIVSIGNRSHLFWSCILLCSVSWQLLPLELFGPLESPFFKKRNFCSWCAAIMNQQSCTSDKVGSSCWSSTPEFISLWGITD